MSETIGGKATISTTVEKQDGTVIKKTYKIVFTGPPQSPSGCFEQLLQQFKQLAKSKCNLDVTWDPPDEE